MPIAEPFIELVAFRGRNDDGSEAGASWIAPLNTNWSQIVDVNFRVRFLVEFSQAFPPSNLDFQLQYNRNDAGWNDVNGGSLVVRSSASVHFQDGDDTTQQLGAGSFISPNAGMDENDGHGSDITVMSLPQECELEYCVQIRAADTTDGDQVALRLIIFGGGVLDVFPAIPIITVVHQSQGTQVEAPTCVVNMALGGSRFVEGREDVIRYAPPLDWADARDGRICSRSGLWFPGRMVVYVDGLPYGFIYAVDPVEPSTFGGWE